MVVSLVSVFAVLTAIVGVLMSLSHFFQAWRIFKRKSADDISFTFYGLMWSGSFVWLIYGFLIHDWPLILSFLVAVIATSLVMFLMLYYRIWKKRTKRVIKNHDGSRIKNNHSTKNKNKMQTVKNKHSKQNKNNRKKIKSKTRI